MSLKNKQPQQPTKNMPSPRTYLTILDQELDRLIAENRQLREENKQLKSQVKEVCN